MEVLSLIPDAPNYEVVDFTQNKKINYSNQIDLLIIKKNFYKSPVVNSRVGDFVEVPIEKVNVARFFALNEYCTSPYYLAARNI